MAKKENTLVFDFPYFFPTFYSSSFFILTIAFYITIFESAVKMHVRIKYYYYYFFFCLDLNLIVLF